MKQPIRIIARVYAWMVGLYPASYSARFEQEMVTLFCELMSDAAQKGLPALLVVCFREFWDLPANLIDAHLSNRSGGERPMLQLQFNDQAIRTARWGAIGFGVGFALINLSRYLLQALGLNRIGDFFTVWILGFGIILYGIAGAFGGAVLGLASENAEDLRARTAWKRAWRCAVAGFFALAFAWFITTIHIPFLLSSSASFSVRASVEGIFTNLLKPLTMGALTTAFISIAQNGRAFPIGWILAGAVAFEIGDIASYYIAQPFLLAIEPFVESLLRLPPYPQNDGLIRSIGFLLVVIQGTVSGSLLGLVFSQRGTETPPQVA